MLPIPCMEFSCLGRFYINIAAFFPYIPAKSYLTRIRKPVILVTIQILVKQVSDGKVEALYRTADDMKSD